MGHPAKPNILIVMTGQQRADLRRSRGYALDTMPFLDEWARGEKPIFAAPTPPIPAVCRRA